MTTKISPHTPAYPENVMSRAELEEAAMSSGEKAAAYAADAVAKVVGAALPEYTIGLPVLSLCVPVIGIALAPAALIAGVMADGLQMLTAPVLAPRSAALAAYHGFKALIGR